MQKMMQFGSFRLIVMIIITVCLVLPVSAQIQPGEEAQVQPGEEAQPGPILRVAVVDLKVQGEQAPDVVREAFTAVLPALVDCLQTEYQRGGKIPPRIMLRFNVGGNGKVVWCKVIEPALKSLDACICKVLPQLQLPATGATISRATVILDSRLDHLLTP
jgi:hypothetical protein